MMKEIRCPKCDNFFEPDNDGYATIVKQIRDDEFNNEISRIEKSHSEKIEDAIKLAEEKTKSLFKDDIANKNLEIERLRIESVKSLSEKESLFNKQMAELKTRIASHETEKELIATKAVAKVNEERDELKIQIANKETEFQSTINKYESILQYKDEEIERIKNMKAELSVKEIGESFEQYCQNEFDKIRSAAFQNSYFGKDNDSSSGAKGDFIFRHPAKGAESISIMFEMKDEREETVKKQKNAKFFAKLDKDRNQKNCEYAILVSNLEADNDVYNQGIFDVSHEYPKMFVIRPQFFIPMITLLKNAAEKSYQVKNELIAAKNQNFAVEDFKDTFLSWKTDWEKTLKNAKGRRLDAIDSIDKAIEDLKKAKEALETYGKHTNTAEEKLEALTLKKLTHKNPTMAALFSDVE